MVAIDSKPKKKILMHMVAIIVSIIFILPIIVVFLYSILDNNSFSFKQYSELLLLTADYFRWFWNSFESTCFILIFNIPISLMAGFSFSQYKAKWLKWIFMIYILLMLMPFQATMIPQYITIKALHLLNTPYAIILPNIFVTFGAFLMSQSMKSIPREVMEAGRIDGLSEIQLFTRIATPLSSPTIAALVILVFIDSWSMVEQPTIFLQKAYLFPLSVTLNTSTFPTVVFAGSIIFSILPLLIYLKGYDKLVNGITLGVVK